MIILGFIICLCIYCGVVINEKYRKLSLSLHMLGVYDSVYMYI